MRPTRNFFFAFIGFIFFFQHASAGEDTHTSNVTINSDTTDQQTVGDGGDNVTLINNATINNGDDNASVQSFGTNTSNGLTGVTIINNSGAIIKQGTKKKPIIIGENSIIAAGSFVTKNVEKDTTVFGSPAKILNKKNIK